MSTTVCPTITADTPQEYTRQMSRIEPFAQRIHVDVADGDFTLRRLISLDNIWWRGNRTIDLHMMYRFPSEHADIVLALKPRLVIIHAESEGNFEWFARALHSEGIEVGVALLQRTPVESILGALDNIDHVLIFSGNLGYQGGSEADMALLHKVKKVREAKPLIEIGWDGGVNVGNARKLSEAGVDVLNSGGFIMNAENPLRQYRLLTAQLDEPSF